ncbi:hypothetical protein AMTRI_Chr11g150870 [Amborella trichopoda]
MGFLCLLRSCPFLETLSLWLSKAKPPNQISRSYWRKTNFDYETWLSCLKRVDVKCLSGIEEDVELIGFLLSNAKELQKVDIKNEYRLAHLKQLWIAKKFAFFPRASSAAKIFIN